MQKTYHRQTAKFLAVLAQSMPEISADVMQGWIEDPKGLTEVLGALCHPLVQEESNIINCDADPFVLSGWKVEEHQKGGQLRWDKEAQRNTLYLAEGQQNGKSIEGHKLHKELVGKPTLNANVLDYLLANPRLIPEEWKGKAVFFWGTIYRNSNGFLFVRYLYWHVGSWAWRSNWLDNDWDGDNLAVLRAS